MQCAVLCMVCRPRVSVDHPVPILAHLKPYTFACKNRHEFTFCGYPAGPKASSVLVDALISLPLIEKILPLFSEATGTLTARALMTTQVTIHGVLTLSLKNSAISHSSFVSVLVLHGTRFLLLSVRLCGQLEPLTKGPLHEPSFAHSRSGP